jgi:hypothetical protein
VEENGDSDAEFHDCSQGLAVAGHVTLESFSFNSCEPHFASLKTEDNSKPTSSLDCCNNQII